MKSWTLSWWVGSDEPHVPSTAGWYHPCDVWPESYYNRTWNIFTVTSLTFILQRLILFLIMKSRFENNNSFTNHKIFYHTLVQPNPSKSAFWKTQKGMYLFTAILNLMPKKAVWQYVICKSMKTLFTCLLKLILFIHNNLLVHFTLHDCTEL